MQPSEATFRGVGEIELYYQVWQSESHCKANIIIVHGFGENTNRWQNVSRHFMQRGFRVWVYDQRGHGRSPGQRGYINDWSELRGDLRAFVDVVEEKSPGEARFLYSMSMGGLVTLDYGLHFPETVSGAICTAPAIGQLGLAPPVFFAAKVMDRVWPKFTFQNPISADLISRDKDWVSFVLSDPLSHGKGSPRLLMQIQKTAAWVHEHVKEWRLPLLLMHGSADAYASVEGSRSFAQNITYPDVKYIEYEGAYHDLSNDTNKEQVYADAESWLEAHLSVSK
jgi:alpha-beta hydrolase superfamily lysophospholipase